MESDVNSVLEYLLSKGQIPSFSFPLDSTMFAAEMISGRNKKTVKHMARYTRDTKLAISELAPGSQRTVNGKKLQIGGLYFEFTKDPINRALPFFDEFDKLTENRVSMCLNENCGWVSEDKKDDWTGKLCPICSTSSDPNVNKTNIKTYVILKPEGLAPICIPHENHAPQPKLPINHEINNVHPKFHTEVTKRTSGYSGRVKLPAPSTNDISGGDAFWEGEGTWGGCKLFVADESSQDSLGTEFVIINSGPDEEGFQFCNSCGASLHDEHIEKHMGSKYPNRHYRPYIVSSKDYGPLDDDLKRKIQHGCDGVEYKAEGELPVALGLRFRTDLILFRFELKPDNIEFQFDWTMPSFHGAVMGFRDALQFKLVEELGLMHREISAGYRLVTDKNKRYVDIYLYDSVSGGAGLVSQIKIMRNRIGEFLESAKDHLDGRTCLEKKACSRACVGCLLDFKNRRDHNLINRPLGWSLARFFESCREPLARDFGISHDGIELDRINNALQAYSSFAGDGELVIQRTADDSVTLPSGRQWQIVSPFFEDDFHDNKIRIDSVEVFHEAFTKELENTNEREDVLGFF